MKQERESLHFNHRLLAMVTVCTACRQPDEYREVYPHSRVR
jgi:hypothetical protein